MLAQISISARLAYGCGSPNLTYASGCQGARNVAVRAERLGCEARAEWIWRSKLAQCGLSV